MKFLLFVFSFFFLSSFVFWCSFLPPEKYVILEDESMILFTYSLAGMIRSDLDEGSIVEVDYWSFEIVQDQDWRNTDYWIDKDYAYYKWKKMEWVDVDSFDYINGSYSYENPEWWWKDKDFVYGSFSSLNREWLSKDKNFVYLWYEILESADPDTFVFISSTFYKDKNHVFYNGKILEIWDAATFESMWTWIYKDKNNVYAWWVVLDWIDSSSLKVFDLWFSWSNGTSCSVTVRVAIVVDKNNIYAVTNSGMSIVDWVDKDSFEMMERIDRGENYSRDKSHVYKTNKGNASPKWWWFDILEWVDPSTFEYVWVSFLKDKDNVYDNSGKIIEWMNSQSFESFGKVWYKDKNNVYDSKWEIIDWIDVWSAELIWESEHIWKDKSWVYIKSNLVPWLKTSLVKPYQVPHSSKPSNINKCITDDEYLILCYLYRPSLFLPHIQEKIDELVMEKIVPSYKKPDIEAILSEILKDTNQRDDILKWKGDAIKATFYRYVRDNLDKYYIQE